MRFLNSLGTALSVTIILPAVIFSESENLAGLKPRKWAPYAVMGEAGLNSLASLVGVVGSYYFKPNMVLDIGLGVRKANRDSGDEEFEILRPGARFRYLILPTKSSPFVGAGLKYSFTGNQVTMAPRTRDFSFDDTNDENYLRLKNSAFLDLCVGVDYQTYNGFAFIFTTGWSNLLGGRNYELVYREPNAEALDYEFLDGFYGSGIMISLSLGFAFKI